MGQESAGQEVDPEFGANLHNHLSGTALFLLTCLEGDE